MEIGFQKGRNSMHSLISGINAHADGGELVALIGQNGIGKSTLLKTIVRLQKSLGGHIFIREKDIREFRDDAFSALVGYVSTEVISVGNLTVHDLIGLGRFPYTNWYGKLRAEDEAIIRQSMEMVSLTGLADKNISEISDGERQRAMIARTIAQDTDILILDEPTAFLDLPNRYEVLQLLRYLSGEKGKLVIFSTHDLGMVLSSADKIWMMTKDHLIQGAPEDLVLNNSFNHLFPDSKASFDKDSGSFSYPREFHKKVVVKGSGNAFEWTKKALERKGFIPVKAGSPLQITVRLSNDTYEWEVNSSHDKKIVHSILELMIFCREL
jgi:iron complex transport system ATP-binding protein